MNYFRSFLFFITSKLVCRETWGHFLIQIGCRKMISAICVYEEVQSCSVRVKFAIWVTVGEA